MNSPAHTPGPWSDATGWIRSAAVRNSKGEWKPVAELFGGPTDLMDDAEISLDEHKANVALIAAAPSLLAACQSALAFWDKPRPTFGCNEQRKAELEATKALIRSALAKAQTGGAS